MARLRIFRKSVAGQTFQTLDLPAAKPPVFDNPTPEQIEAYGLDDEQESE